MTDISTFTAVVTSTASQSIPVLDKLIGIMNSAIMGKILALILGLLGAVKWLKNRAIQRWTILAFETVEEIARTDGKTNKLDKIALFTETFEAYMKRAGWLVVTQSDIEQAKAIAKSVNLSYTNGLKAFESGKVYAKDEQPVGGNAGAEKTNG